MPSTDLGDYVDTDRLIVNIWTSAKNKNIPGINVGHMSIQTPYMYISLWPAHPSSAPSKISKLFEVRSPKFMQDYTTDTIMEALAEARSEYDNLRISDISEIKPGQLAVLHDPEKGSVEILNSQPKAIDEKQYILGITPCQANVRIAFYTLSIGRIHQTFNNLKESLKGWKLIGSNILTQAFSSSQLPENCASLVYRLLQAGGMAGLLGSTGASSLCSETSSVVKPDVLVKFLIKAKDTELHKYPKTQNMTFADETSLEKLKEAYGVQDKTPTKSAKKTSISFNA